MVTLIQVPQLLEHLGHSECVTQSTICAEQLQKHEVESRADPGSTPGCPGHEAIDFVHKVLQLFISWEISKVTHIEAWQQTSLERKIGDVF